MSIWLQKKLVLWFVSAMALSLISFSVVAQVYDPNDVPPSTTNEAARLFGRLLVKTAHMEYTTGDIKLMSNGDRQQLGGDAIDVLLEDLSKNQKLHFAPRAEHRENGRIVTAISPEFLPVVLVAEAGGYRVDLIATYGKRLGLGAGALERAVYTKTNIALDGLPGKDSPTMQRSICQSNLKQIWLATLQYAQDYDEKYPPAKSLSDLLQPYASRDNIFNCPALPKNQRFGYSYNSKLAAKEIRTLNSPSRTVFLYETSILKRNAYGSGENLAFRHQNGANYAFADGHVKWFPKAQTPSFKLKP